MFKNINREKLKQYGFWGVAAVILLAIIIVIIPKSGKTAPEAQPAPEAEEPIIRYVTKTETIEVEKLVPVEVEKEITTDILQEGLQNMGRLITQEYWFKEVTSFESTKTYAWVIKANSKLVMGYEGQLNAGIDFTAIRVVKDDTAKIITVTLPKSEIFGCEIDFNSFELYQEDVSKWNPISASDYNGSLVELTERATSRALERGILEKADENARNVIQGFIGGLVDLNTYKLKFA